MSYFLLSLQKNPLQTLCTRKKMAASAPGTKYSALHRNLLILTCCFLAGSQLVVVAQHNNSVYYANLNSTDNPTTPHTYNNINASDKAFPETIEIARSLNTSTYRYDEYEDESVMDFRDKNYEVYEYLRRTSLIFGLASMANGSNVNTVCSRQMRHIQQGILRKEPWAMKGEFLIVSNKVYQNIEMWK